MPDAPSPATLDAQDRFRVAQRGWAVMYDDMHDAFLAYQRAHSLGSPGPWNGAVLDFLAGRDWDYPCVSTPGYQRHCVDVGWYGAQRQLTIDTAQVAPFNRFACYHFQYPATTYQSRWALRSTTSYIYIRWSITLPQIDHWVICIPTVQTDTGVCGQGFAVRLPDKE